MLEVLNYSMALTDEEYGEYKAQLGERFVEAVTSGE